MSFGKILKTLLDEHEMSQVQLSSQIGYTQRAVSKWVNEQAEPSETAIRKTADFFEVSTDYLLGRSDDFGNIVLPTKSPTVSALTDEERQLLEIFSRMDRAQKIQALGYCEGLISIKTGAHYPNFKA